ncbi:MAG: hypothetical protein AAGD11_16650 [Planctomycetota bacterium]
MTHLRQCIVAISALSTLMVQGVACALTADLGAVQDNTIYEHPTGSLSNGAGNNFFAGVTGGDGPGITRGLIMFDIASEVPAEAIVTSATLTLNVSMAANSLPDTIELRRVLADWGEGDSIAGGGGGRGGLATQGDATWLHSFSPGTNWSNVGGDFSGTLSAATSVGGSGSYSWSSTQLASDVQEMLFDSHLNYGWGLLGNESFLETAKRFDSRENPTVANRPVLTIEYELPGGGPGSDFDGDDDVDGDDLDRWADSYGSNSDGDADGDNDTDGADYLVWQTDFSGQASLQSSVVPEPSTAMLGVGLLSLAALNRRCNGSLCRKP